MSGCDRKANFIGLGNVFFVLPLRCLHEGLKKIALRIKFLVQKRTPFNILRYLLKKGATYFVHGI